jgi:hypothetical protein
MTYYNDAQKDAPQCKDVFFCYKWTPSAYKSKQASISAYPFKVSISKGTLDNQVLRVIHLTDWFF